MKKSTRKWMALFTVAAVLAISGSAFAYGGKHHYGKSYGYVPAWGPGGTPCPGWHQGPGYGRMQPGGPRFDGPTPPHERNVDIPQAIRDKQVEADKLRIDLRAELSKPQIDKAKALETWKKHRALRDEIAEWFFTQRMEWLANRPNEAAPTPPKPTTPQ